MLNIFIQPQYPVLTDIYKEDTLQLVTNNQQENSHDTEEFQMLYSQTSKISPNINQLIKSMVFVLRQGRPPEVRGMSRRRDTHDQIRAVIPRPTVVCPINWIQLIEINGICRPSH